MGDIVRRVSRGRFLGWYIRYKDVDGRRKQRASHQPTRALAARMLLEIEARVAREFEGDYKLNFHLAPPLFARKDPVTGHLKKAEFGPWVFKAFALIAKLRKQRKKRQMTVERVFKRDHKIKARNREDRRDIERNLRPSRHDFRDS